MEHPRKDWYGFPTQVWAYTPADDIQFRKSQTELFSSKQCPSIGEDSVLVISPIPMNYTLFQQINP